MLKNRYNKRKNFINGGHMRATAILAMVVLCSNSLWAQDNETKFPPVSALPEVKTLPDPFTFFGSNKRVATLKDWEKRREEMKALVQYYEYGKGFPLPYNTIGNITSSNTLFQGKATLYEAELSMGVNHSVTGSVRYLVPTTDNGRYPVLMMARYYPQDTQLNNAWLENVIDRGYMVAEWYARQYNPYRGHERTPGQVEQTYPDYDGSVLQEWSWGGSGVITYLSSLDVADTNRVIFTGLSRLGKTALLTGVMDERVDLVVAAGSGCQGMPVFRYYGDKSCTLKKPATIFPGWSVDRFKEFIDKETLLPFDQHFMAAMIAPRAVLAIEGSTDNNANQEGSQESYRAARQVYEWLQEPDHIGWYEHTGGHTYNEDDVYTTLDFADLVFEGRTPESGKKFDQLVYPPQDHLINWTAPIRPAASLSAPAAAPATE